jgi:hypothetical protein
MMSEVVFIGGDADGERKHVNDAIDYVHHHVLRTDDDITLWCDGNKIPSTMEVQMYTREKFYVNDRGVEHVIHFFKLGGMSYFEAINLLFNSYGSKSNEQN